MVSSLITAYDQNPLTIAHIKGCMNSSLIPSEIIVVNDGGDDSLKEMIKGIPNKKCPIVYARITEDIRWNQNGARNLAVWLSRGDLLAFEDNDHIPQKNFYKDAVTLIEQGYDRVFVKGRIVVSEEDILRWSANIDGNSKIPKFIADNETIREVMYSGLWLIDELVLRECSDVNIVALQFKAGKLSFGRDPWEVHQKVLRDYERLDVNCVALPSEMN